MNGAIASTTMSLERRIELPEPIRASLALHAQCGALDLPVLPDTAARVLGTCDDEACDARDLAEVIERDQALAVHVLRVVNSAAYAPTYAIVSLQQAVARLGFATLCEIAVGVAIKGKVFRVNGFDSTIKRLWKHSAATGAYAKEIARTVRTNVESAFLCGLLHDIGKPIALQMLAEICAEADVVLDHELAEAAMDEFHGTLGGMLIRHWKLAPWVETAVEHHHDYSAVEEHRDAAMITNLADVLAHLALGTRDRDELDPLKLPVVADLELYEDDVENLLAAKARVLKIAEAFA